MIIELLPCYFTFLYDAGVPSGSAFFYIAITPHFLFVSIRNLIPAAIRYIYEYVANRE